MSEAVPLAPGLHVLGAFAALREATITSRLVTSVCPSVSPLGTSQLPLDGFQ
jgi:hypothetical protein